MLFVFVEAAGKAKEVGLLWLVIAAIAMSAVSLYYYLQVLKQIYVVPAEESATDVPVSLGMKVTIGVLALLVILLGCFPNLLVGKLVAVLAVH